MAVWDTAGSAGPALRRLGCRQESRTAEVFDWYMSSGDVEIHTGCSDPMTFHVSQPSADHLATFVVRRLNDPVRMDSAAIEFAGP